MPKLKILLASDKEGFSLKTIIKKWLSDHGYLIIDLNEQEQDSKDLFQTTVDAVSRLKQDKIKHGLIFSESGVSCALIANKFKDIRACNVKDTQDSRAVKMNLKANILCFDATSIGGNQAKNIIKIFFMTKPSTKKVVVNLLSSIKDLEDSNFK